MKPPAEAANPSTRELSLIVCYDIVDDDVRLRVADLLATLGPRVQLSTFECRVVGTRKLAALLEQLSDLIDSATDQVRIYSLGSRPHSPTIVGQRELEEWHDYWII